MWVTLQKHKKRKSAVNSRSLLISEHGWTPWCKSTVAKNAAEQQKDTCKTERYTLPNKKCSTTSSSPTPHTTKWKGGGNSPTLGVFVYVSLPSHPPPPHP